MELNYNSSFVLIQSCQQILPDYEDLTNHYELLAAIVQYFSKSSSLSSVCHTSAMLTKFLNVVVPSENFRNFLTWE